MEEIYQFAFGIKSTGDANFIEALILLCIWESFFSFSSLVLMHLIFYCLWKSNIFHFQMGQTDMQN